MALNSDFRSFFVWVYYQKMRDMGYSQKKLDGDEFERLEMADLGDRRFETQIHKVRDGLAICELCPVLHDAGYRFGGSILNVPSRIRAKLLEEGTAKLSEPMIREADLLLLNTRPPLHDHEKWANRQLLRSDSEIERSVFASLSVFFQRCDRSQVILQPSVSLEIDEEDYRTISFHQNQGGRIAYLNALEAPREPLEPNLTVGYLVSLPTVQPQGFRFLAAFGLGGTETLWFSHTLRTCHCDLLQEAIQTEESRLWLVPFLVPEFVPDSLLQCDPDEFVPKQELSRPIICH